MPMKDQTPTMPGKSYTPSTEAEQKPTRGSSIGELVAKVTAQFSALVRDEIAVVKLQAKEKVVKLGMGGVLLAVAALIALYLLGMLFIAAGFGLGAALGGAYWAGFLIVAGILLVIVLILALVGAAKLKASSQHQVNPAHGLSKDVDAFKKGLNRE